METLDKTVETDAGQVRVLIDSLMVYMIMKNLELECQITLKREEVKKLIRNLTAAHSAAMANKQELMEVYEEWSKPETP